MFLYNFHYLSNSGLAFTGIVWSGVSLYVWETPPPATFIYSLEGNAWKTWGQMNSRLLPGPDFAFKLWLESCNFRQKIPTIKYEFCRRAGQREQAAFWKVQRVSEVRLGGPAAFARGRWRPSSPSAAPATSETQNQVSLSLLEVFALENCLLCLR